MGRMKLRLDARPRRRARPLPPICSSAIPTINGMQMDPVAPGTYTPARYVQSVTVTEAGQTRLSRWMATYRSRARTPPSPSAFIPARQRANRRARGRQQKNRRSSAILPARNTGRLIKLVQAQMPLHCAAKPNQSQRKFASACARFGISPGIRLRHVVCRGRWPKRRPPPPCCMLIMVFGGSRNRRKRIWLAMASISQAHLLQQFALGCHWPPGSQSRNRPAREVG